MTRFLISLSLLGMLYGLGNLVYYWDPTRVLIKKLTAKTTYRYEKIDPKYLETDPKTFLNFPDQKELTTKRKALQQVVYGLSPQFDITTIQVKKNLDKEKPDCYKIWLGTHLNCKAAEYKDWPNLAGIDRLGIPIVSNEQIPFERKELTINYTAFVGYFRPQTSNGRLILIHQGYAGVYHEQHRHIKNLIKLGYSVMAFNLYGYGLYERSQGFPLGALPAIPNPQRLFFNQVKLALNYALDQQAYKSVDMVGLSAGAWVTSVFAALDTRIRASYPVSGVFPVYLREPNEKPAPQLYPPLLKAASYLEMFVLASSGKGRRQMQVFNRYDRCCYRNLKGKLYEGSVKEILAQLGQSADNFTVLIDETHARHKISAYGMKAILADMTKNNLMEEGAVK
ncbi:MAG: hypothetical protein OQJ97_08860 [Rhodospirillales bacterium]|nr:hypothetical protein [Rhodospirillales bacterium]